MKGRQPKLAINQIMKMEEFGCRPELFLSLNAGLQNGPWRASILENNRHHRK